MYILCTKQRLMIWSLGFKTRKDWRDLYKTKSETNLFKQSDFLGTYQTECKRVVAMIQGHFQAIQHTQD